MNSRASKNLAYIGIGKSKFASNPMLNELRSGIQSFVGKVKDTTGKLADSVGAPGQFDISGIYKNK